MQIMKRMFLLFIPLLAGLLLTGCSGNLSAPLNSKFTLQPGQAADIQGQDLTVKFAGITADSRCPQGANCIVAGDVTIELIMTSSGKSNFASMTQLAGQVAKDTYKEFEITATVSPYPVLGHKIQPEDYRVTFTVKKL
jgi:hypothetical protein